MGIAGGSPITPGPAPDPSSASPQRRCRFRNHSHTDVKLSFYNTDDSEQLITLSNVKDHESSPRVIIVFPHL